jgi:transcriptional regulator with PAS, ATPase and Fis domain
MLIQTSVYVAQKFKGVNFGALFAEDLVEECRRILDPLDYKRNLSHWTQKVKMAEHWLFVEQMVSAPPRGKNRTSEEAILEAISLAKDGYSKSEIANRLGIKRNTFSNWIKRNHNLADAFRSAKSV